jgi:TonB family protein
MTHPDILDQHEGLKKPLLTAVLLHGSIAGLAVLFSVMKWGGVERWGDPNSLGGGAVGITPVSSIPLPSREGPRSPLANDTESQVPSPPPEKAKPIEKEIPDAIPIKGKPKTKRDIRKAAEMFERQHKFTPKDVKPNQVYSKTGAALNSEMFSRAGGGGVGSGTGNPFGTRLGWYEKLLRDRVAQNWRSQDLDRRLQNPVVVLFTLMRDGSIRNVRVTQSSGNVAYDLSAQRAIETSAPFPALPREFERDSANLEFWFRLEK